MRRREFISAICTLAWLPAARAQQAGKPRRIAFVHSGIPADHLTENAGPFWVRRFYKTLRELGYVEAQNLVVERYSAEGRSERFAALAAEIVGRNPEVIVANSNDLVATLMKTTATIPIVGITGDPIAGGLLTNLGHPGGNLTGVSINAGVEIYGKRLQLLKEVMPSTTKVTNLLSGSWSDVPQMAGHGDVGRQLGIELVDTLLPVVNSTQLHRAFADITQQGIDAVMVDEGGSFLAQRALIVELAAKFRIPVVYPYRDYVELGGMMAYAPDLAELAARIATDVHQILNGTKPGDIPFFQPSKFQLLVNTKAVSTLGLTLPQSVLSRADDLIE